MSAVTRLLGLQLFDVNRNGHNKPIFKWHYGLISFLLWIVLIPFLVLQLAGLFGVVNLFGLKKRRLSEFEITELKLVFANSVDYSKIRIREKSTWAKVGAKYIKTSHLGFVFLNTVHFSRNLQTDVSRTDMAWLVHEATHVSQYQKLGIIYIVKALRAQRNGGYRYEKSWLNSELKEFNFEQQADIAKAYYIGLKDGEIISQYNCTADLIRQQKFC
ncbi:MAG: hypothetical protein AB8B72_10730 [Crocinitomicaceae bacterium]